MKQVPFVALCLYLVGAMGCVKSSSAGAVKADGSATVKLTIALQNSTMDKMRTSPDDCSCWTVYQIHRDSVPAARRAFSTFESGFDAKKVSAKWSELGLNVTNASMSESDGWRTLEIEASTSNVAEYNRKLDAALKAAAPEEFLTAVPWYLHTRKFLPRLPRFCKTPDPTVVKVVIPVVDNGDDVAALANLSEEWRDKLVRQFTYMRGLRGFNQGSIKIRVKLPGTIISVENAKQEGSDTVVFEVDGRGVDPDAVSRLAKAKGHVTAMLKVDPSAFKIALED